MADPSVYALSYGHPGQPFYDTELREWLFTRKPGTSRRLRLLAGPQFYYSPSDPEPPSATPRLDEGQKPGRLSRSRVNRFLHDHSELLLDEETIRSNEHLSNAVQSVTASFDPLQGDLLDIGHVKDIERNRVIEIAAFPCGESGDSLRLVHLMRRKQCWNHDRSIWLEFSAFEGETGFWSGDGAPIRQVRFSDADGKGSMLAVRLPRRIVIFRPLFLDAIAPVIGSQSQRFPLSRLHANPVASIPSNSVPHTDVVFNPWYSHQIATVDRESGWCIYEISGKQPSARLAYSITLMKSGAMMQSSTEVPQSNNTDDHGPERIPSGHWDGWARITWSTDVHTVVVCNRRHLQVIRTNTESEGLEVPNIVEERDFDWILDMRYLTSREGHVVVLTSSSLRILRVEGAESRESYTNAIGTAVSLTWKHYLSKSDLSLRTQLAFETDNDITALVYSRLTHIVTSFQISTAEDNGRFIFSRSDPSAQILFHSAPKSVPTPKRLLTLLISLSRYRRTNDEDERVEGVGNLYEQRGVRFFELVALFNDFSIGRYLCCSTPSTVSVEAPQTVGSRIHRRKISTTVVGQSDFIVEDGEQDAIQASGPMPMEVTSAGQLEDLRANRRTSPGNNKSWTIGTVENELVVSQVVSDDRGEAEDLDEAIITLQSRLESGQISSQDTLRTLFEIASGPFTIVDIFNTSNMLVKLCSSSSGSIDDENRSLVIRPIASQTRFTPNEISLENGSLLSLYQLLVNLWLDPLPSDIPLEFRLVRGNLASQISAEVFLSSWRIMPQLSASDVRMESSQEILREAHQGMPPGSGLETSLKGKGRDSPVFESIPGQVYPSSGSSNLPLSLTLPTPESTPSLLSASSGASSLGYVSLAYLKRHTSADKSPVVLSPTMSNILAHWTIGEDPSAYSWVAKSRELNPEDEGEGLSTKQRKRLERRMKRHLKMQRKDASVASSVEQTLTLPVRQLVNRDSDTRSSPMPSLALGIQPQPASQSLPGVASQVVKGRFGGRQVKKKRIQGF